MSELKSQVTQATLSRVNKSAVVIGDVAMAHDPQRLSEPWDAEGLRVLLNKAEVQGLGQMMPYVKRDLAKTKAAILPLGLEHLDPHRAVAINAAVMRGKARP